MNESEKQELASLIGKFARQEGVNATPIPGVFSFKASTTERLTPSVYDPSLCIVAQGRKQAMLGEEIYYYNPSDYLVVSVDLPMIGQVTEASTDNPYLCMKIRLDFQQISELLVRDMDTHGSKPLPRTRGLFVGKVEEPMSESVLRLARLLNSPEDIPVLAPSMIREVYYRLLRNNYGSTMVHTALKGSNMQRIASVIRKLKAELDQPISVKALAELANMSVSTFHLHFKSVTAMSPLQFQKRLRLIEARHLMLSRDLDVAATAYQVGYESPSQFSREYARMFGKPPGRDISQLRQHVHPQAMNLNEQHFAAS
ncbi:AraC family transcriptional regulator [Kineobactrum salinum]|uniref:AraC family transcriptional regulator n=1 Tax=Kineobactrum salinum TaxID=2708301 RepID=A0A6C0TZW6_9GAMM|nr:AraC family transcriptional regulator [Kineobactrum salinum]QIB64889.1 AraC family transcriptional regulator [Kineobactrum salinum]